MDLKEEFPFIYDHIQNSIFSNTAKAAYSHSNLFTQRTEISSKDYIYEVRKRVGYVCPNCGSPKIEPSKEAIHDTIPSYNTCQNCDWKGTNGAIERNIIEQFTDIDDVYDIWVENNSYKSILERDGNDIPTLHSPTAQAFENRELDRDGLIESVTKQLSERSHLTEEQIEAFVRKSLYAKYKLTLSNELKIKILDLIGEISNEKVRNFSDSEKIQSLHIQMEEYIDSFLSQYNFRYSVDKIVATRVNIDARIGQSIPVESASNAVGCSSGYYTSFELIYLSNHPIVLPKEHRERRIQESIPNELYEDVLERDNRECVRCENPEVEVHHIIPVSNGGASEKENLAAVCHECHYKAHGESWSSDTVYDSKAEFWSWVNDPEN